MELVFIKWIPNEYDIELDENSFALLNNQDVELIKESGIKGKLKVVGGSTKFEGKQRAKAIIIMKSNIKETLSIPQPHGDTAIYIQSEKIFNIYPKNVNTLERIIELRPSEFNKQHTLYRFESANVNGGKSGGTAFGWK